MAEFQFVIPLNLDGLKEFSSNQQYVVSDVATAWEIPKKIQEAQGFFRQYGTEFILKSFDGLYSLIVNFASVDEEFLNKAWELMSKAMGKLISELGHVSYGQLTSHEKHKWLNLLKMTTYISCQLTEAFENRNNKSVTDILQTGKCRKKKKGPEEESWEERRNGMLVHLYTLMLQPLQQLWEPPVVEEDFVNMIASCCYKILESSNMGYVSSKGVRTSLFQIIGVLVKKFNHGIGCSLKIMQLLQDYEHMVTAASEGIIILIQTYEDRSVLSEIIREISKMSRNSSAKDTPGIRNFTQFLVEVSSSCPQVVVPSLSLLINFLDEEVYIMRNCVLSILGSVVFKLASSDDLDDKSKDLRDQCLDHLEEHIHDIHAFVRSKVLQIWNDLIREKAVPLRRQHQVLKLVLGRLWDKSSIVRKNAMQLLTAFVNSNPFAAKLPLQELESQYAEELKKLQDMCPESSVNLSKSEASSATPMGMWRKKLPKVIQAVLEVVNEEDIKREDDEEDNLEDGVSLNSAVKEISEAVSSNKLCRAVRLLGQALQKFKDVEVLDYDQEKHSSKNFEEISKVELTSSQLHHLVVLERIFLSSKQMEQEMCPINEDEDIDADEETEEKHKEKEENFELVKQKTLVTYLKDSVKFAKLVHEGLPVVSKLLDSRLVSDVMEAISFFVTVYEFGVLDAMTGVRKMLTLVWSKEKDVQSAVVAAYRRLYVNSGAQSERAQALHIVENLSKLISDATLGERTSMEEIVARFMESGDITKHCVTLLWERFTKNLPGTTDDEARTALILLAMCANSEQSIISSNLSVLTTSGFSDEKDFTLMKETCTALLKIAVRKPKTEGTVSPFRLDRDHEVFERLSKILVKGLTNLQDRQYSPMAVEAVSVIYALAEHPDQICGEIIQEMCRTILNPPNHDGNASKETIEVSAGSLSRFLVVVGHVAISQLMHLDTYVFSELKRRNNLREEMEIEKQKKKKKKNRRKSHSTSASGAAKGSPDLDIDEEIGLTGAVADDMEAEYIRSVCETEILDKDNLLGTLKPLIWTVCTKPDKYKDTELQTACILALAKYMMVSSALCEENLQLMFTVLEKSKEAVIRANAVIALGDLYFRFPNQLEPWTPRLYARLRDSSPKVRQNTLTILTHLVLNDMVKVKGQISDIALCIDDEDPRISGLANLLFSELGKKGNALYNVLPDIISRLSDTEVGIEEESFRKIMGHVLSLLEKEKQRENLVEKLCHRFQATINVRQWRDIAFCLSRLQFNEKSIKKLSENFSCYADKLYEPEVYDFFSEILSSIQKTKPEIKLLTEELEKRIVESHEKGVEDENTANKAYNAKIKSKKNNTAKKKGTRHKPKKTHKNSSSESESENEDARHQLHPAHRHNKENVRQSARLSRSARKSYADSDDSVDEDEEADAESDTSEEKDKGVESRQPLVSNSIRSSRKLKKRR